jgi:hypothetical protein
MLQRNQEQIAKRIGTLSIEDPTLGSSYAETGRDLSFPLGMDPGRVALAGPD